MPRPADRGDMAAKRPHPRSTTTKPAVELDFSGSKLHLVNRPREDTSWVREKFKRADELLVKGTLHSPARFLSVIR